MATPPYPEATPDGRPYKFLFICGHMRSGTNWVRNLVNGHPDVAVYGEGPFGYMCTAVVQAKKLPWLYTCQMPAFHPVVDAAFAAFVKHCMLYLATLKPTCSWVVDNTSRQVWPYIPGTHHIHIRRDVRDVIVSWTFHQLAQNLVIGEPWRSRMAHLAEALKNDKEYFAKNPHMLLSDDAWVRSVAQGWKEFMLTADRVKERMQEGSLHLKLLDLSYEGLVADTQGAYQAIFDFMGLDITNALPLSVKNKTLPGFSKENPTGHYRAGKVRDWEQYATPAFRAAVNEVAGDKLIQLGYERSTNW